MSQIYDVLIIGGGPGGYLAAERLGQGGMKACLFEECHLGGTCLNEGCIPTKTLLNSAKHLEHAKNSEVFGVKAENVTFDHAAVIERKCKVTKTLVAGVGAQMRANKVNVVKQHGDIVGKTENGFAVQAADGTVYEGRNLIIATGGEAIVPGIPGVKEGLERGFVLTNREFLALPEVPEKLVIIGAGSIGLEMATYFNTAGSKVTVVEMMNKIAGTIDGEISGLVQKDMEKHGIEFRLGSKVTKVTENAVEFEKDGKTESVEADKVIMAIGRRSVTDRCGLEKLGVAMEKGSVITDEHLRTNVPGVYAIGDAHGKIMLAHIAYREAEVAANVILGKRDCMRYDAIPAIIFSYNDAACVGESEESAKAKGIDYKVRKVSMLYSGRFVAENENVDGICKILTEKKTDRVIGVHMFGGNGSESIWGAAIMIESHWSVEDFKEIVFPHPTVCEAIREAMFA